MAEPYFDIYVLSDERNTEAIEKFLMRYCDRAANEMRDGGQEIAIYKSDKYGIAEQFIPIDTLTAVIRHGTQNLHHGFCFYISRHLKGVKDVMLKFTYDGKMVFGVSIDTGLHDDYGNYPYAKQLAGELKKITKGYKENITVEYAPADDEEEFDADVAMWQAMNDEFQVKYPHP